MEFLERLFHDLTPAETIELRWKHGRFMERDWVTNPEKLLDSSIKLAKEHDVYYGVCTRQGRVSRKTGILSARSLWADVDSLESQRRLNCFRFPPSVVVSTGHGRHAYWLLKHRVDLTTSLKARSFETLGKLIELELASDPVHDITRILRVPGTINHKEGNRLPVDLVWIDLERTYDPNQLWHALGRMGSPG